MRAGLLLEFTLQRLSGDVEAQTSSPADLLPSLHAAFTVEQLPNGTTNKLWVLLCDPHWGQPETPRAAPPAPQGHGTPELTAHLES